MRSPEALVLSRYGLENSRTADLGTGLINQTKLVTTADQQRYVLQQVNPMFSPAVNEDIRAVTQHLRSKGILTPELVPTLDNQAYVQAEGAVWRLLTYIDGRSFEIVTGVEMATEAGALLARFHRGLADFPPHFKQVPPAAHDTKRHLQNLRDTLIAQRHHANHQKVTAHAEQILALAEQLAPLPATPARCVHGDPKLSNLLFDAHGRGLCLVDLDTLATMPAPLELGDALRSWCNPSGEDTARTSFSLDYLEATLHGYLREDRNLLDRQEQAALVLAAQTIMIELAARFCADALNETYFAWDPKRFESHSDHNLTRSQGQLSLAASLIAQHQTAEQIVADAFARDSY